MVWGTPAGGRNDRGKYILRKLREYEEGFLLLQHKEYKTRKEDN